jgi:hypothetical protein
VGAFTGVAMGKDIWIKDECWDEDEVADILHDSTKMDLLIKAKAVFEYCEPHLDQMWAARVCGILLGCDFKDAREHVQYFYDFCTKEGL